MQNVLLVGDPASGKKTWIGKLVTATFNNPMGEGTYCDTHFITTIESDILFDRLIYMIDATQWCALLFDFQRIRERGTAIPTLVVVVSKIDLLSLSAREIVMNEIIAVVGDVANVYYISNITGENIIEPLL
jgi:GTPase Era involved in 16S rRNA processing